MNVELIHMDAMPWAVALLALAVIAAGLAIIAGRRVRALLHPMLLVDGQLDGHGVRQGMRAAAIALFAVAALGPAWGTATESVAVRHRDVLLLVDVSRSMRAEDVAPDRLTRVRELIDAMLQANAEKRFALVLFAGDAWLRAPFTLDHAFLLDVLAQADPETIHPQGTNLNAALDWARRLRESGGVERLTAVLVSDGEHTGDTPLNETLAALRQAQVRVLAVAVGNRDGAPVPSGDEFSRDYLRDGTGRAIVSRPDREQLAAIAAATDGQMVVLDADTATDSALFQRALDGIAARDGDAAAVQHLVDRAAWPLALGFLSLAASLLPLPWLARQRGARARSPAPAATLMAAIALPWLLYGCDADRAARAAFTAGNYDEAARWYGERAASSGDPAALANLGASQAAAQDYASALSAFVHAATRDTDPQRRGDAWHDAGNAAVRLGDYAGAVTYYQRALSERDDPDTRFNQALARRLLLRQPPPPPAAGDGTSSSDGTSASQPSPAAPDDAATGQAQQPQDGQDGAGQRDAQRGQPQPHAPVPTADENPEPRDEDALGVLTQRRLEQLRETDPFARRGTARDDAARPW